MGKSREKEDTGQMGQGQGRDGVFSPNVPLYFLFLNQVSIENYLLKKLKHIFLSFYNAVRLFHCWGFRARK